MSNTDFSKWLPFCRTSYGGEGRQGRPWTLSPSGSPFKLKFEPRQPALKRCGRNHSAAKNELCPGPFAVFSGGVGFPGPSGLIPDGQLDFTAPPGCQEEAELRGLQKTVLRGPFSWLGPHCVQVLSDGLIWKIEKTPGVGVTGNACTAHSA